MVVIKRGFVGGDDSGNIDGGDTGSDGVTAEEKERVYL